jgi:hypothetical protein
MKSLLILPLLLLHFFLGAQASLELNPEERAYLYHIVKKSPILDVNIGRYFEYKGPEVRFMNKELNYDSIENIIINRPDQLFIRTSEIAKSPKGILAEAANKMALWELNKVLLAARQSEKDLEKAQLKYDRFEALLTPMLPGSAFKPSENGPKMNKKLVNLLDPGLNFQDKAAMLGSFSFLSDEEQLQVSDAINSAINRYTEERSFEIFRSLGGQAEIFRNELVAAGDGSETSGLLDEREKDETGRWNKGLPKAVGLFPYQAQLIPAEKRKKTAIESAKIAVLDFETAGENKLTQLHFDVWGYNGTKQTTVVIERNGLSYHLFGSADTRFLSPDSTFSSGKTFQAVINELRFDKIAKLEEMIHGKKGFDYQIEENTKKMLETELKINRNEGGYSSMRESTIYTSSKPSKSVKKARKKSLKNGGGPVDYQPTTYSGKQQRGKSQSNIVALYSEHAGYKRAIEELKRERQEAIDLMAIYQRRLDYYNSMMGYKWASFTEKDGLYTFEDSTTFDMYTQDFTFLADTLKTGYEVRLLAIPFGPLSDEADEVMLHVNMTDARPGYDARLQVELGDVFASNSWTLGKGLFTDADSVAVMQLFEGLLDKKVEVDAIARGQGVGEWNGIQTVRAQNRAEYSSYPGSTAEEQQEARSRAEFARLRTSKVSVTLGRSILFDINTYTDPVSTDLRPANGEIAESLARYGLNGNDYLSAMRTAAIIRQLKTELNVLAGSYLPRERAKVAIDRLNKVLDSLRVSVGPTSFKWQELLEESKK